MFEEFKSAFHKYNNAPVQLIIINVVLFIALAVLNVIMSYTPYPEAFDILHRQFSLPPGFVEFLSRPWTLITYMFTHDLSGILHILFNMLVLYWFGRLFTEYLGSDKLIALYVLGGLAGGIAFLLAYNTIEVLIARQPLGLVGASASINAIVVATAVLLPNYTFFLLFFGPVRIKYIAGITVLLSFIGANASGGNVGGNIAHLGGALIGWVYMKQLQAGSNWGLWVTITLDWIKNLFKDKPRVKVSYRNDRPTPKAPGEKSSYTQEEIDAILDKISAGGYESLTKEEKEKLFNASKKS
ncbi:MAG TPA: rhomboid family intramembrane serine protease [Chryseosolibacter sp.]|nr:rhomboid family intramembrane serine protease [Chryseosolibacter sp.]